MELTDISIEIEVKTIEESNKYTTHPIIRITQGQTSLGSLVLNDIKDLMRIRDIIDSYLNQVNCKRLL